MKLSLGEGTWKKVGKHEFIVVKTPTFKDWLLTKMSLSEFTGVSGKEKWEIFLNWKWGFTHKDSNESLEFTERDTVRGLQKYAPKDWENMSVEDRDWFGRKIKWSDHCDRIWQSIENGMFFGNAITENVRKQFGGKYV